MTPNTAVKGTGLQRASPASSQPLTLDVRPRGYVSTRAASTAGESPAPSGERHRPPFGFCRQPNVGKHKLRPKGNVFGGCRVFHCFFAPATAWPNPSPKLTRYGFASACSLPRTLGIKHALAHTSECERELRASRNSQSASNCPRRTWFFPVLAHVHCNQAHQRLHICRNR